MSSRRFKHFCLNAHETNRTTLDAKIDPAALRESEKSAGVFKLRVGMVTGLRSCARTQDQRGMSAGMPGC